MRNAIAYIALIMLLAFSGCTALELKYRCGWGVKLETLNSKEIERYSDSTLKTVITRRTVCPKNMLDTQVYGKWHIKHYSTTGKLLTDTLMEETWSIWGGGITKIKFKEYNQNGSVTSGGAVKSKNPHW